MRAPSRPSMRAGTSRNVFIAASPTRGVMPSRFLQEKACLMILLLVLSPLSFFSAPVAAQAPSPKVCCEKTKDGSFCQYTASSNCDLSVRATNLATPCEDTSYCQSGCCLADGACFKNAGHAQCLAQGGEWNAEANCALPQCQTNCCVLPGQCSYTTDAQCALLTSQFPDLSMDFRSVANEAACLQLCAAEDQGCCVTSTSCSATSREQCQGQFFQGSYCSQLTQFEACTACTPRARKGCLKDDVYWFDSCGNPENLAEDCSYDEGTLCGEIEGDFACKSTNCPTTYKDSRNVH